VSGSASTAATRLYDSPIGPLLLGAAAPGVVSVQFLEPGEAEAGRRRQLEGTAPAHPEGLTRLQALATALDGYFAGESATFDGVRFAVKGSDFNHRALEAVRGIPPGQTRSYGQIAREIGRPLSVRAVARANAANPLPILIPCHRVIGSDGSLTGYGGGLERKRWLLDHERKHWGAGLFAAV
jgi:O-6-methylguanine DNA methyltransferase